MENNSCERALLSLTKNWKFALDEYNVVGVLSMDMSKAFDSLADADDHQFYVVHSTLSDVHDDLAVCPESASSWYRANLLKGNLDKYQTMAFGCGKESMDSIMIDNHEVRSTECLKLLAVCIDNNQSF